MANRIKEQEKKKKSPMAVAGIPEIDKNIEEVAIEEEIKPTPNITIEEIKKVEPEIIETKVEEPAPVKEEKVVEQQDLFTIRKKIKIKKGQKNLTLKEENIEALTAFARKYGFNENEVVDYLIENYLKLIKIK